MAAMRRRPRSTRWRVAVCAAATLSIENVVEPAVVDDLAQQHHRRRVRLIMEPVMAGDAGAEQQAVDTPGQAAFEDPFLVGQVLHGLLDQHHPRPALRLVDDVPGQLAEVGHVELGDHQRDHPRASPGQVAGGEVGLVAEVADRLEHLGASPFSHVREIVDDVGHRLLRDARARRHIGHPGPPDRLPCHLGILPSCRLPRRPSG